MKISVRYTLPKVRDYVVGVLGAVGVAGGLSLAAAMPPESVMLTGISGIAVAWLVFRVLRMGRLTIDERGLRGGRWLGRMFELSTQQIDDLAYSRRTLTLRTGGQLHELAEVWPIGRAVRLWLWWWHRELPETAFAPLAHPPLEVRNATRHVEPIGSDGAASKPWTDAGFLVEDGSERVFLPHRVLDGDAPAGMPPLALVPLNGLVTAVCALGPADRRLHLRRLVRELYGSVLPADSLVENALGWRATITPGTVPAVS